MTGLSHLDPAFSNVVAIEAVNEPIMDASLTPGYGNCASILFLLSLHHTDLGAVQKNFVQVMRTVELMLGIPVSGYKPFQGSPNMNFTLTMAQAVSTVTIPEVQNAVIQAIPILLQISLELKIDAISNPAIFWAGSATRAKAAPLTSKCVLFLFLRRAWKLMLVQFYGYQLAV
jgi:glucan endo-1,6-beta-glucosidase